MARPHQTSGEVRPRPRFELRKEERSLVRTVISRLDSSAGGWTNDDDYAAAALIRYLLDIHAMLRLVAPDWWSPRQ